VCGQYHAPAGFTPGEDPIPIVQEAGWAQEPVWIGAENLASPGFDPRTFQPVASRYTDYAIPAPNLQQTKEKLVNTVAPYIKKIPNTYVHKLKSDMHAYS
jgi:hypothetical protein